MTNKQLGARNFRRRIAVSIRDGILHALDSPSSEANYRNIPLAELGPVAELTPEQQAKWNKFVAGIVDRGIQHFLYGLDNQADGFEIRYYGDLLNEEGEYLLSDSSVTTADESEFDRDGKRRSE